HHNRPFRWKSSVQTNNTHSEYFALNRSTRQGCPLSPLLFALAIEPLAILLRSSKEYAGINRGNTEHKVSLYADDLLLYVSDLIKSIPIIMTILENFGRISGYKLNLSKSILFPINSKAKEDLSGLFKHNYSKLLPISLAGRINIVRMNILPKFLFLFQNVPILITKSFFNKLDSLISYFIWNKKTPKIKKTFLQRPPSQGGMGLPCFSSLLLVFMLAWMLYGKNYC
uniref:Reverse transcriptase domain-containing protein n=1 Tax=Oryzias latipes TaxID=8090 RepID=A0A3P9ITT7_ORYLA